MTSKNTYEYQVAISYAGPDVAIARQVSEALRERGLRVFFAPDEQADIVGRNLIDYLSDVYLNKARYCLIFVSQHYAARKWTDRVERPAAQARSLEQTARYIIPVRLDEAKIPGLLNTTAEIRDADAKRIADIMVSVVLSDEEPTAITDDHNRRDKLLVRATGLTNFDTDGLKKSFSSFSGWTKEHAFMIPVELRLPEFIRDTLSSYKDITATQAFSKVDEDSQDRLRSTLESIDRVISTELLRAPISVIVASQDDAASRLVLSDHAAQFIARYTLARTISIARCLASTCLRGFPVPNWAHLFADCASLWSTDLLGGLAWLCRHEGSERHLWLDADIYGWGVGITFERVRVYLPSKMAFQHYKIQHVGEDVLRFIGPQLLKRQLDQERPFLLQDAFHYPERIEVMARNEWMLECGQFRKSSVNGFGSLNVSSIVKSLCQDIEVRTGAGREEICDAYSRMDRIKRILSNDEIVDLEMEKLLSRLESKADHPKKE